MIESRKVLITVKTYPTLSTKYAELVCTAGILDDGKWVRIFPMPFRKLEYEQKYKKYQWIELKIKKSTSDYRPESFEVVDWPKIKLLGDVLSTKDSWRSRRNIVFAKNKVYQDLTELIEIAKQNKLSLAIFKPTRIIDFIVEATDREWDEKKLKTLENRSKQLSLIQTHEEIKKELQIVKKLPYKFSYCFEDINGKKSTLMIEDWEIGALYWNCLRDSNNDEELAIQKVRQKYWDEFLNKDLHFFLGTTLANHLRAPNPFVIIGLFPPPKEKQQPLFTPFEIPQDE
jgi:hypothetical protein